MFSLDLTADERHARMGHMTCVPTAAFISGADEYAPVLPEAVALGLSTPEALARAMRVTLGILAATGNADDKMGGSGSESTPSLAGDSIDGKSRVCVIEGGNHGLTEEIHARDFVSQVEAFIAGL